MARASRESSSCGVAILVAVVVSCLLLVTVEAQGQGQGQGSGVSTRRACGTRFLDAASSAVRAEVVVEGRVESLPQSSPLAPRLLTAVVAVNAVLKGRDSFNGSSPPVVHVQHFSLDPSDEDCVASVSFGYTYVFFARVKDGQGSGSGSGSEVDPPLLENTGLPQEADTATLREVRRVVCDGCAKEPVIKRLRCQRCAAPPKMKRPMSTNETRTLAPGKKLALRCVARGSPRPEYTWVKDGALIHGPEPTSASSPSPSPSPGPRKKHVFRSGRLTIRNSRQHSLLVIKKVQPGDAGTYQCLAANAVGETEQKVKVIVPESKVKQRPSPSPSQPDTDPGPQGSSDPSASGPSDLDPCALNPCYNGGSCSRDVSRPGGVVCTCPPRYHGRKCQFRRRPLEAEGGETTAADPDEGGAEDGADTNTEAIAPFPTVEQQTASQGDTAAEADPSGLTSSTPQPDASSSSDPSGPPASTPTPTGPSPAPNSSSGRLVSKKKRRKYTTTSRGRYGATSGSKKPSKSRGSAPKLKVSACPDSDYCFNGGTCSMVVKIKRRFCECPRGFAGRRCEVSQLLRR